MTKRDQRDRCDVRDDVEMANMLHIIGEGADDVAVGRQPVGRFRRETTHIVEYRIDGRTHSFFRIRM